MVDQTRVVYGSSNPTIITSIPSSSEKSVVLTFDDGPSRILPEILDVLKKENIPAVFFWQTRLLHDKRPWKRVLEEGHLIGTHTTKHVNLTKLPYHKQYKDIKSSIEKIQEITGTEVKYFRPPFGQFNNDTIKAAKELHVTPVMWRIASIDWELKNNPQQIITNVLENLVGGSIILLHELQQTLEMLPELIKAIQEKGYHFKLL
ncbi:polysaccharide deacetylase family protein [Virgibacillus sp. DJP39]|uniref:polysaccharide deacetylase family protein n=1 Tax=Virgibacillus sp. DJP39 TaxID=3409790 RepID=UPI003BB4E07B